MNRRHYLDILIATGITAAIAHGQAPSLPIQLHVDLQVQSGRENELINNYKNVFSPVIRKQPGFVDVKLLKFRSLLDGKAAGEFGYRLVISFDTEENRQRWVKSPPHQKVWPEIEKTLKAGQMSVVLYDTI